MPSHSDEDATIRAATIADAAAIAETGSSSKVTTVFVM